MKRILALCMLISVTLSQLYSERPPIDNQFGDDFAEGLKSYIEYSHLLDEISCKVAGNFSNNNSDCIALYIEDNEQEKIVAICNLINCQELAEFNIHNIDAYFQMTRNLSNFFFLTPEKYEEVLKYREFVNFKQKAQHSARMLLEKGFAEEVVHFANKAKEYIEEFYNKFPSAFKTNCVSIGDEEFCWDNNKQSI